MVLCSIIHHDTVMGAVRPLILYVLPFSCRASLFTGVLLVLGNKGFGLVDTSQLELHDNYSRRQEVGTLEHHHADYAWHFSPWSYCKLV